MDSSGYDSRPQTGSLHPVAEAAEAATTGALFHNAVTRLEGGFVNDCFQWLACFIALVPPIIKVVVISTT